MLMDKDGNMTKLEAGDLIGFNVHSGVVTAHRPRYGSLTFNQKLKFNLPILRGCHITDMFFLADLIASIHGLKRKEVRRTERNISFELVAN